MAPSVQRRKVWLTPTTRMPCSSAAKTRNPLKLAGVPQTNEMISAASGPKFAILWGHVEEILLLNTFFPIVDMCRSCEDIARQSCAMVPRWRSLATFLRPVFAASREQHISDLHSGGDSFRHGFRQHKLECVGYSATLFASSCYV